MPNDTFIPPNKKKKSAEVDDLISGRKMLIEEAERRGINFPKELLKIEDLLKDKKIELAVAAAALSLVKTLELAYKEKKKISPELMIGILSTILLRMEKNNIIKMNRDNN